MCQSLLASPLHSRAAHCPRDTGRTRLWVEQTGPETHTRACVQVHTGGVISKHKLHATNLVREHETYLTGGGAGMFRTLRLSNACSGE
jgi:hypothetical protein